MQHFCQIIQNFRLRSHFLILPKITMSICTSLFQTGLPNTTIPKCETNHLLLQQDKINFFPNTFPTTSPFDDWFLHCALTTNLLGAGPTIYLRLSGSTIWNKCISCEKVCHSSTTTQRQVRNCTTKQFKVCVVINMDR